MFDFFFFLHLPAFVMIQSYVHPFFFVLYIGTLYVSSVQFFILPVSITPCSNDLK